MKKICSCGCDMTAKFRHDFYFLPLDWRRKKLAVFNVCPHCGMSVSMQGRELALWMKLREMSPMILQLAASLCMPGEELTEYLLPLIKIDDYERI